MSETINFNIPWVNKDKSIALKEKAERLTQIVKEAEKSRDEALSKCVNEYNPCNRETLARLEAKAKEMEYQRKSKDLNDVLTLLSTYAGESVEDMGFIDNEHPQLIATRRHIVNANRKRYLVSKYPTDSSADEVDESHHGTPISIHALVNTVKTSCDELINIDDYLLMNEQQYDDDKETCEKAIESIHNMRYVNAENKYILSMLINSKEAINTDVTELTSKINDNLCGNAKRKAVIYTNKNGFKKLDTIQNGVNLIKKINGEFIFNDKYVVREFSNNILPNNEDYSPVLIGDFENIIDVGIIDTVNSNYTEITRFRIHDRSRASLIPTLTTTSNEAYIICNI